MNLRYEIDNNNVVTAWYDEIDNKDQAFVQTNYPDGTAWNKDQATAWAESAIMYYSDPDNNPRYSDSPTE
jgi:hypothetical protein